MKRNKFSLSAAALIIALGATSCLQEQLTAPQSSEGVQLTFEAVRADGPSTKTQIGGEDMTEILWSPGDAISVFYGEGKDGGNRFVSTAAQPEQVTKFTGIVETITGSLETDFDETCFFGVYPYNENNALSEGTFSSIFPALQNSSGSVFPRDAFFTMGRSEGLRISFYNLCGGIRFTLDRNDVNKITLTGNRNETVAGPFTASFNESGLPIASLTGEEKSIVITAPNGRSFSAGTPYFIALMPMVFEEGFTLTFENEMYRGTRKVESKVEILRSEFKQMPDVDKNVKYGITSADLLYSYLCFPFCSEAGYSLLNYGTDEYSVGVDNSNGMWNDYNASLSPAGGFVNSNSIKAATWWDYMYTAINTANAMIAGTMDDTYVGADAKTAAGVAYFIRAFHYYNLLTQFGGVPIELELSSSVPSESVRATKAEVFDQILSDFLVAYQNLPATASAGEISKSAAAHFLAKSYLWRASELNDDWNGSTKASDLDNVIKYANEVIAAHPLAPNFVDIWDYTAPDGPNEQLDEIVLAARMAGPTWQRGGCLFFYTTSQYRDLTGMFRDVPGGREYNRLRTTTYSIYQYDLVNDSRVWKTFRTKMTMNNVYGVKSLGYTAGKDLGLMYIFNQPGDDRFEGVRHNDANKNNLYEADNNSRVGNSFVFFPKGTVREDSPMDKVANNDYRKYFPMNTKYVDGSRESIADSHCLRDGIIARSVEDYFFLAEAQLRKGDYAAATATLNIIRARAAWKAGEDREEHRDGGQAWDGITGAQAEGVSSYCNRSSYYESNNLTLGSLNDKASSLEIKGTIDNVADLPAEDQWIVNKLGISAAKDVALCFLLNEKSREMSLELVRWVDLARTKTLVSRVKAFNEEAAVNIQEYHYLRPIPQTFLDGLTKDGKPLSDSEKAALQNPGY